MITSKAVPILLCSVISAAHCADALAFEWLFSPTARVAADYADNPRMLANGGAASAGTAGEFGAGFTVRSELAQFTARPRVRFARYRDDESLDSDDQYLDTALTYRSERVDWAASAGLTRDSTLTSELDSTGFVQTNRRHEALTLSAGPTWVVSERLTTGAQIYWADNHYVNAADTGLVDYEYRAASLLSGLQLSERDRVTLNAQGGELVVPQQSTRTRDATLRLGWRHELPWLWTFDVSAGPSYVETAYGTDSGAVFKAELQRQRERWSFNVATSRDLTPTGRGVLTRRDQLGVSFKRRLTERLNGNASLRFVRNQDLLPRPGVAFQQVDYTRADVSLDWRFAQHWSLALAIGGATQSYETNTNDANNYQASIGIVWNGQAQSL